MLADAAVIVRAGTRRVDDAGLIEFDLYLVGLVLAALDRCFETVATTCNLTDGTVFVVLLSSVV
ncbi:hypothetical protein [Haloarcula sp. JP-L23]|uniref:hypothetical protein n=1 Tax=Haloarcula sp. JP-L23 TaxID=2716717 RepID=UPI001D0468F3